MATKWKISRGKGFDVKGSVLIFLLVALLVNSVIPDLQMPLVILLGAEILYGLKKGALFSKGKFNDMSRNTLNMLVPIIAIASTFSLLQFAYWNEVLIVYALAIGWGMFKEYGK